MEVEDDLRGVRILLIEDDTQISELLQELLCELGCEIAGAAMSFGDAQDMATNLSFDISLLDINLSGQLSYPIAKIIAERQIKFLFVTGYTPGQLAEPFQGAAMLSKPFGLDELKRALRLTLVEWNRETGLA